MTPHGRSRARAARRSTRHSSEAVADARPHGWSRSSVMRGSGKTRLTTAFLDRVAADAQVLRGRCLPYGDGITFWPIAEVVRAAAAIEPTDDAVRSPGRDCSGLCGDEQVVDRVASAIGLADDPVPGAGALLGHPTVPGAILAAAGPLVVVLDDIHWAEATFLELIGHLTDEHGGCPDPDPVTARGPPSSSATRHGRRATSSGASILGPLSDADAGRVAESLLGGTRRSTPTCAPGSSPPPRAIHCSSSSCVSMLLDDGSIATARRQVARGRRPLGDRDPADHPRAAGRPTRPACREPERAVVDPASVIGLQFARAALASLVGCRHSRRTRPAHLASLEGRQFVRRPRPTRPSDGPTYRFGHILIRDATYEGLLKRTRAELHERFVAWADEANRAADRATEFEEILGYHLEQAHRYLGELGPYDEHGIAVGIEASRRLAAAGGRAADRGDVAAARNLLGRAVALLPVGQADRPRLLLRGRATRHSRPATTRRRTPRSSRPRRRRTPSATSGWRPRRGWRRCRRSI